MDSLKIKFHNKSAAKSKYKQIILHCLKGAFLSHLEVGGGKYCIREGEIVLKGDCIILYSPQIKDLMRKV